MTNHHKEAFTKKVGDNRARRDRFIATVAKTEKNPRVLRLLVYLLFEHYNAGTEQCNPKIATIAQALNVSVSTTKRAVADAQASGWLRVTSNRGRREANDYTFCWDQGLKVEPSVTKGSSTNGSLLHHQGLTSASPRAHLCITDGSSGEPTKTQLNPNLTQLNPVGSGQVLSGGESDSEDPLGQEEHDSPSKEVDLDDEAILRMLDELESLPSPSLADHRSPANAEARASAGESVEDYWHEHTGRSSPSRSPANAEARSEHPDFESLPLWVQAGIDTGVMNYKGPLTPREFRHLYTLEVAGQPDEVVKQAMLRALYGAHSKSFWEAHARRMREVSEGRHRHDDVTT